MDEVFAVFSEDVWKGLPKLRVQSQVRAWLYAVARNALARHSKSQRRWHSRHVTGELEELQLAVRHSITGGAGALAELEPILAGFSHADRYVLEQRLLLSRAWRDIARDQLVQRAQDTGAAQPTEAELERECARLRKRYQLLMQQLRERMPADEQP
jgi:DNA-directed RNA polymerase specialized sigma24 family protein